MRVGQHKCRNSGDAALTGMSVARTDIFEVGVAVQKTFGHGAIQTYTLGDIQKHGAVTDILALFEIRLEKAGDRRGLAPFDT